MTTAPTNEPRQPDQPALADTELLSGHAANAERVELDARREGRCLLFAGITLGVATLVAASLYREITGAAVYYEITTFLFVTAAVLTLFGLWERLQRRNRAGARKLLLLQLSVQENLAALPDITARLARIEQALDEVAAHLPENQKIHNWRGYNAAILTDCPPTGTDGATPSKIRLEMVRDHHSGD